MTTENLDIEYSLFLLLFSNQKQDVMRKLLSRNVGSDYFAAIFHREIFELIVTLFKQGKQLSLPVFKTTFLSRPGAKADDEIKMSQFLKCVKAAKASSNDMEHLIDMLIEMYVMRKTLAKMNEVVDQMHIVPIGELIGDFEQHQRKLK